MANAFLVEPLAIQSVAAEGSAAGTSPDALTDDMIGVVHRGTGIPSAWVEIDLGAAQQVDFAAFLATEGNAAGQRVRAADTQANLVVAPGYDSGTAGFEAGNESGAFGRVHSWWDAAAPQSFRWWRFDLSGLATPFAAGRLVIGRKLRFARNFSFGAAPGIKDLGRAAVAIHGALDRRRGTRLRTLQIAWAGLRRDEVERDLMPMLERLGRSEPLLVVTDPAADPRRARRMYFGWIDEDAEIPQRHFDQWEWRTKLVSVI